MIVWALFDSGNGCYKKAADKIDNVEIYSIGLDIENKNDHFINLDLSDYSYHFTKNNVIFDLLNTLPKPDLIIASPPCESWSVASAMPNGNASWKQEKVDDLFKNNPQLSRFTIRGHEEYESVQFKYDRSFINRINGELCIYNTIKIIEKFKPDYYIIENPAYSRVWDYIDKIIGFKIPYDNLTYYNNYGFNISKPTKFKSNIDLTLKCERMKNKVDFNQINGYNKRSNIPEELILDIFEKVLNLTQLKRGGQINEHT